MRKLIDDEISLSKYYFLMLSLVKRKYLRESPRHMLRGCRTIPQTFITLGLHEQCRTSKCNEEQSENSEAIQCMVLNKIMKYAGAQRENSDTLPKLTGNKREAGTKSAREFDLKPMKD